MSNISVPRRKRFRQNIVHTEGHSMLSGILKEHLDKECDSEVDSVEIKWSITSEDRVVDIYCPMCGDLVYENYYSTDNWRRFM